jgi:hypothetical protein
MERTVDPSPAVIPVTVTRSVWLGSYSVAVITMVDPSGQATTPTTVMVVSPAEAAENIRAKRQQHIKHFRLDNEACQQRAHDGVAGKPRGTAEGEG